jgi:leucyl aminopeptidase
MLAAVRVSATTDAPAASGADTIAIGVFDGEGIAHDLEGGPLQALLDAGEARTTFRHIAQTHAEGRRWIVVGLGDRDAFDAERARMAAGTAHGRAKEMGTETLAWEAPHHVEDEIAGALVEGTVLAAYEFDRYKSGDTETRRLGGLVVSAHHDVSEAVATAAVMAEAQNAARDLQNTPPNDMTPKRLAERASELGAELDALNVEIAGRDEIVSRGMGAFAAVARGSYEEPALITMRYEGPDTDGPILGMVGKAVTFDSGGISIKPALKMSEMKFDMSGGAAVIEAIGAIARLRLPIRVVGVVGATENMPSGRSMRPGDIVKASNGKTIEILNTDAEGRLVLCDCLVHAVGLGAERVVDIATLTGGASIALGSVYAAVMGTDDELVGRVEEAGRRSGDKVWRMPSDPEYDEALRGQYGDIANVNENRRATTVMGGRFLAAFVGDTPWAHIDIAATSWDRGKPYAPKGGAGFGVRLLIELARALAGK